MKRMIGVDLGEKNIGISRSDPFGISATALCVIRHINRTEDASRIITLAQEAEAEIIVVGQPLGTNGEIGPAARHAAKVAEAIQAQFNGEVILWDESGSTRAVKNNYIAMNISKKRRRGHLDADAAAWILQDYLRFLADFPQQDEHENT